MLLSLITASGATWWHAVSHFLAQVIDNDNQFLVFSVRQHICYSALYAIAHPSVRPSHGCISQRRLKLGSRNLHQRVAPWPRREI